MYQLQRVQHRETMAETESITSLVTSLCKIHLQCRKNDVGNRINSMFSSHNHRNGTFRVESTEIKRLKILAYGALLKKTNKGIQQTAFLLPEFSEIDEILAHIYKMRVLRQFDEANRLETLLNRILEKKQHHDEIRRCLRFLACLKSIHPNPERCRNQPAYPILSKPKDSDVCVLPSGPLLYGDTRHVNYGNSYYMHYPREVFEKEPVPMVEDSPQNFQLQLFRPSIEFDPLGLNLFASKLTDSSRPQSFFGGFAQSNSETGPLGMNLHLPISSTDAAKKLQQLEDTATCDKAKYSPVDSGVELDTPGSSSTCNGSPFEDIWEKALKIKSKTCFSWESIGCLEVSKEPPFLTEAGPQGLESLYLSVMHDLSLMFPDVYLPPLSKTSHSMLISNMLNILTGIGSNIFPLSEDGSSFSFAYGTYVEGITPETLASACEDFAECGTKLLWLEKFSLNREPDILKGEGLTLGAFKYGVRSYIEDFRGVILSLLESRYQFTILQVIHQTKSLRRQLHFVTDFCKKIDADYKKRHSQKRTNQMGIRMISHLYNEALKHWGEDNYSVLLFLLKRTCMPYIRFLHRWVYEGVCFDPFSEFNIISTPKYQSYRDEHYWSQYYRLSKSLPDDEMPLLTNSFANDMFLCGKTLELLRVCNPQFYICKASEFAPELKLFLSREERMEMNRKIGEYIQKVEELAQRNSPANQQASEKKQEIQKNQDNLQIYSKEEQETDNIEVTKDVTDIQVLSSLTSDLDVADTKTEELQLENLPNWAKRALSAKSARKVSSKKSKTSPTKPSESPDEMENKESFPEEIGKVLFSSQGLPKWAVKAFEPSCDGNAEVPAVSNANSNVAVISPVNFENALQASKEDQPTTSTESEQDVGTCLQEKEIWFPASEILSSKENLPDNNSKKTLKGNQFVEISYISDEDSILKKNLRNRSEENRRNIGCTDSEKGDILRPICTVEPYRTSFPELDKVPRRLSDFEWFKKSDGNNQSKQDCADYSQYSLPVLISKSILPPIKAHITLVNKCVVDYFKNQLPFKEHLLFLRNFLFFQCGEFGHGLSHLLCAKLSSCPDNPHELLNPFTLNFILSESLEWSLHGNTSLADNLSFAVKKIPCYFSLDDSNVFKCLELRYKVPWPCNILITESHIDKYNKIFGFLLQVKYSLWSLNQVWYHLKYIANIYGGQKSPQLRILQLYRHEMLHLVSILQSYVISQVLQRVWKEFEKRVDQQVENLDDLINAHHWYLEQAISRCMLEKNGQPTHLTKLMSKVLDIVVQFHRTLTISKHKRASSHLQIAHLGSQKSVSNANEQDSKEIQEMACKNEANTSSDVVHSKLDHCQEKSSRQEEVELSKVQCSSRTWYVDPVTEVLMHSSFDHVTKLYKQFKEHARYLYRVLTDTVEMIPHPEDLLAPVGMQHAVTQ